MAPTACPHPRYLPVLIDEALCVVVERVHHKTKSHNNINAKETMTYRSGQSFTNLYRCRSEADVVRLNGVFPGGLVARLSEHLEHVILIGFDSRLVERVDAQ